MNIRTTMLALAACAALMITPAKAADIRQCNIEVMQKKTSFNVGIASALVLERLAKSERWSAAFAAADADRETAVTALVVQAMALIEEATERPGTGDYINAVAVKQVDVVSEAITAQKLSVKLAVKGDPKLVPLLILGSGFETAKVIGDSVTMIASAWLSSCNKAVTP